MKKFLSIFVALAMVFSLFAGFGARTAKAAPTATMDAAVTGVVATNGTLTITLSAVPTTVGTDDFTATSKIDAGAAAPLTLGGFAYVAGSTTVTYTFPRIVPTAAAQSVVVAVTNVKTLAVTAAPAFIVPVKQLTIAAPALTLSKVADTTTTAAVTAGALSGVAVGDVVTVTAAANYNTAAVGIGKTITVVYTLAGTNSGDYTKPVNYVVTNGVITAAPVAPAGTPILNTPTQVSGTTNVLLSWTYSLADATAFNIYRSQISTPPIPGITVPTFSVPAGTMSYTDATTAANQVYFYWVGTSNAMGVGATVSAGQSIVTTAAVPVVVPGTTAGTLTLTPAGSFVGGVDGSGVAAVDALGKVTAIAGDGIHATVTVNTVGAGSFDVPGDIAVLRDSGVTTADADWASPGYQWITLSANLSLVVGETITVTASSTNGVGKIVSINATGTLAYVNVTTPAVGIVISAPYGHIMTSPVFAGDSIDPQWTTAVAGSSYNIAFTTTAGLAINDLLDVSMLQATPGTSATAFLIVSGTPVKGDIATVTWQDTLAASHTVSYTAVATDTAASVATALGQLINALNVTTGNVKAVVAGSLVTLTQDVAGVAGNGKTLTATTTASVTPTLTIHTVGGLNSPAYVELGKTIKLVAVDATGAVVSCTWTSVGSAAPAGPSAVVNATGLVTADLALTGVTVVTATSGSATGVFAVVVIPVQVITSLKVNLVPAVPVSTTSQQFGAIASNAAYSALDYTTQAVWTDALPVASINATTGLLTYSTDETGNVYASAGGITATANAKITTGVVTLVTVVGPVTKVVVLTIGSDIVTVDDKATTVDAAPEIVDGRTFVPIRFIAETFGSTVTWLPETKGITILLGATTIGLQIGNATAVINGTIIALDAAPYIKNSRTMVPLRVITESFGGNVAWDPINHIITITYVLPVVPVVPAVPAA